MFANAASALLEPLEGMLDFALSHGAGGDYEGAIGDRVGDVFVLLGGGEDVGRADCGNCIAKGGRVGIDHTQVSEAEVAHGACGCANVQGIARGDEYHAETVEFEGEWQGDYFKTVGWFGIGFAIFDLSEAFAYFGF